MNAPDWLRDEVINGLQALLVLRLPNAPSHETTASLGSIWIAVILSRPIAWDQQQDTLRVRRAFAELMATATRWPSPAEFLRSMSPRAQQLKLAPPVSRSISHKNREILDALLTRLKSKTVGTVDKERKP